jgi:hypothetical protein
METAGNTVNETVPVLVVGIDVEAERDRQGA